MFAVPGWSVSSRSLKTQTLETSKQNGNNNTAPANGSEILPKSNKKRKRSSGKSAAQDVNPANLADLWETVIEGKPKPKNAKQVTIDGEGSQKGATSEDAIRTAAPEEAAEAASRIKHKKVKTLKEKKREKKSGPPQPKDASIPTTISSEVITKAVQATPTSATKDTTLQAAMRQKLISARFRHLNQTLYTTPSTQSQDLFQQNPEMFQEYHEGFRRQVEVWPENPVTGYISQIKTRGKARGPSKGAEGPPLPRTEGICRIADLGCGDAALAQELAKDCKKLKLKIFSYDLQSSSPLVTKADIADLPLEDGSVDVAIFCLALMGTNWIDFIEEAFRILRWKGELWVAEIKSRFGRVGGKDRRVEHSVGNKKRPDKKAQKKLDEDADDEVAMVEVDGVESKGQETDVSAFAEILRKRGFVLQAAGNQAVDLSNKMFVKMHFVKGLTPVKGKCVPLPKGMAEMGMETWKKKPKAKFLDEEDVSVSSEASALKPCVYKLR